MNYVCKIHPSVPLMVREEMSGSLAGEMGIATTRLVSPCPMCKQESHLEGFTAARELVDEHNRKLP